ncbi:hypothetical protein TSUD_08920 [Trifolium subterraneum]|nr:hypothetical protein TSUD_08920 [Trifolium subterraneum]
MPKVMTSQVKSPKGWELIEPTLRELQGKMREAENDPHDGKRKCESSWPIFKIAHSPLPCLAQDNVGDCTENGHNFEGQLLRRVLVVA